MRYFFFVMLILIQVVNDIASAIGANAGQQRLVLDMTNPFNKVAIVEYDEIIIKKLPLLEGIEFFQCHPNGIFLARKTDGTWLSGNILDKHTYTSVNPKLVQPQSQYASISPDGKGIIWLLEQEKRYKMVLTDLVQQKHYTIRIITGVLAYPSWSPDNHHIAYYSGSTGVYVFDGYIVNVMDIPELGKTSLYDVEWLEHMVTPPSGVTRMSPTRSSPPLWSPDSTKLVFEASYNNESRMCKYMVALDGTNLKHIGGQWSQDGQRLYSYVFKRKQEANSLNEIMVPAIIDVASGNTIDIGFTKFPSNFFGQVSWRPDGKYYVTGTTDGMVIVNVNTGKIRLLYQNRGDYYPVTWISQSTNTADLY